MSTGPEATVVRRIALVGAECTGKTTLARALAHRLPAVWVPETLRAFCETRQRTPRADEQDALLREQQASEARAVAQAARDGLRWVVCDSVPLITALYSAALFDDHGLIDAALAHHAGYALTLLTDASIPWRADGFLRDGPAARAVFDARLRAALDQYRLPHRCLVGDAVFRLDCALSAIARL